MNTRLMILEAQKSLIKSMIELELIKLKLDQIENKLKEITKNECS